MKTKRLKLLQLLLVIMFCGNVISAQNLLHNNCDLVTHQGIGAGGADVSQSEYGGLGRVVRLDQQKWICDDFIVGENEIWNIEQFNTFFHQKDANANTFDVQEVFVTVYDVNPKLNPSALPIWGDETTNRKVSHELTGVYRVKQANPTAADRMIFEVICSTPDLILESGQYWVCYTTGAFSGMSPTVHYGSHGDGVWSKFGDWYDFTDGSNPQVYEVPYDIYGNAYSIYAPAKVSNLTISEPTGSQSITLSWANPSLDVSGGNLSDIDSIKIYQEGIDEPIHKIANSTVGGNETVQLDIVGEGYIEFTVVCENDNGQGPANSIVGWVGNTSPIASIDKTSYDYGVVGIGTTKSVSFIFENTGYDDLVVNSITDLNGTAFSSDLDVNTFVVHSNQSESFNISFSPVAIFPYIKTVNISTNAGDFEIQLWGEGQVLPESFEAGSLPEGWLTINNNANANEFNIVESTASYHGDYLLSAKSQGSSTGEDDWLIIPNVTPSSEYKDFKFWASKVVSSYTELFDVKLSTTGTDINDFTVILGEETDIPTSYTEFAYDLTSYIGQEVHLAINYKTQTGSEVRFDYFTLPLSLDDMPPAPTSVTNLNLSETAALAAEISWTNPALDVNGDPLSELSSVEIFIEGQNDAIYTIENPVIGANATANIVVEEPAIYNFIVVAKNSEGDAQAELTWVTQNVTKLWENPMIVTHEGQGFNGADLYVSERGGIGRNIVNASNKRIADNFVVNDNYVWTIDSLEFCIAQKDVDTLLPDFDEMYVAVYNVNPKDNPSALPVWGDLETNRITSIQWSKQYALENDDNLLSTDNPIFKVQCAAPGLNLTNGEYWVAYTIGNFSGSAPVAPLSYHGDAIWHHTNNGWMNFTDWKNPGPTHDAAFNIYGSPIHVDETGSISGTVIDEDSNPVGGANITFKSDNSEYMVIATTDANGEYLIEAVVAGNFSLSIEKHTFENYVEENIEIIAGENTVADATLDSRPLYAVTGHLVDNMSNNIANTDVYLNGYGDYSVVTDADGNFTISDVYRDDSVYVLSCSKLEYTPVQLDVLVQGDVDLGDVVLVEELNSVEFVDVEITDTSANVSWKPFNDVYYQNFSQTPLENWVLNDDWSVANEELVYTGSAIFPDLEKSDVYYNKSYDNFVLECSMKRTCNPGPPYPIDMGTGGGIFLRSSGSIVDGEIQSGYIFNIKPSGDFYIHRIDGGVSTTIKSLTSGSNINTGNGVTNILKVVAIGNTFSFYVNNTLQHSFTDDTYSSGVCGTRGIDQHCSVLYFDDFLIDSDVSAYSDDLASYNLYRTTIQNLENPESWDLIQENTTDTAYADTAWPHLASGVYYYGVESNYSGGYKSETIISEEQEKMIHASLNISSNSGTDVAGVTVKLTNNEYPDFNYEEITPAGGVIELEIVGGNYSINCFLNDYHYPIDSSNIAIGEDSVVNIVFHERKTPPYGIEMSDEYVFTWNDFDIFFANFESEIPQDWTIETTNPNATWHRKNGPEMFGDYYMDLPVEQGPGHQDEWLITNSFIVGQTNFSFYASYWPGSELGDQHNLKISKDGGQTWDLIWNAESEVNVGWFVEKEFKSFNLAPWEGKEVKLAFHGLGTESGYGMCSYYRVDNVRVEENDSTNVLNYIVYVDGVEVNTTTHKTWTAEGISYGTHTLGVKTVYASGESEMTEFNFNYDVTYETTFHLVDENNENIEGVEINIDGNVKTTNANGVATYALSDGDYSPSFAKVGFDDKSINITVDGSAATHEVDLVWSRYDVEFVVKDEFGAVLPGASVEFNGEQLVSNSVGIAEFNDLLVGEYDYTVSKEDFKTVEGTINVEDDNISEVVSLYQYYDITFTVKGENNTALDGATVTIDGFDPQQTNTEGVVVFSNFIAGEYEFDVTMQGYIPIHDTAEVDGEESIDVNMQPDGITNISLESIKIHPNPTSRFVYIETANNLTSIKLSRVSGELLQVVEPKNLKVKLDLGQYEPGIYIISVTNKNGVKTTKIIRTK